MHLRDLLPLFPLSAISEVLTRCANIDEYLPNIHTGLDNFADKIFQLTVATPFRSKSRSNKNQNSGPLSVKRSLYVIYQHHERRILITDRSPIPPTKVRMEYQTFVRQEEEASGALEDPFNDDELPTLDHLMNSYANQYQRCQSLSSWY